MPVSEWTGKPPADWADYNKPVDEGKLGAALLFAETELEKAKSSKKGEDWTRALLRLAELRWAQGSPETTLRLFQEQPWPEDLLGFTATGLAYAESLGRYMRSYGFKLLDRQRVVSNQKGDLSTWTYEQFHEELLRVYQLEWEHRDQLGNVRQAQLAEHIKINDYPPEIRPTLRDAVAYMVADALTDRITFRPDEESGIAGLDLDQLMGAKATTPVALDNPSTHSLQKMAAVLDDLERFHRGRGDIEAAFEAKRVRLEKLDGQLDLETDHARLRDYLAKELKSVQGKPWWSMGMATLAELAQREQAPDHLIRARALAVGGETAFPKSPSGQRCRFVREKIEQPSLDLEGMLSDGPYRPSLGVRYKNLRAIYLKVYPVDIQSRLRSGKRSRNLAPKELDNFLANERPAFAWKAELPTTQDYESHRTFITPPMGKPGFYLVVASVREDFSKKENLLRAITTSISDLVLVTHAEGRDIRMDVFSAETGRPVPNAEVSVYETDRKGAALPPARGFTNALGTITFPTKAKFSDFIALAEKDSQSAVGESYYGNATESSKATTSALIYTDRSAYRPLQTVKFKAVVYRGERERGNFQVVPRSSIKVSLLDAYRNKVEEKTLVTNQHGSATGEFLLPAGRILGQWTIQSSPGGYASIRVEEYKRPTIEATLLDPASPLRLNQEATLSGQAHYYFGQPVTAGKVRWHVIREPNYAWWSSGWSSRRDARISGEQTVATGLSPIHPDGKFEIHFLPKVDPGLAELGSELSLDYHVEANVTDEGGETIRTTRSFQLGFAAVEAKIVKKTNFLLEGKPAEIRVLRTNLDGSPARGKGQYRLVAIQQPANARLPADEPRANVSKSPYSTPEDARSSRWDASMRKSEEVLHALPDGEQMAAGELAHDEKGQAVVKLPGLGAGAWRIKYVTTDAFGAKYETTHEFVVAGAKTLLALPAYLQVENATVKVGESVRVLVSSGLPDQSLVLDRYRDGNLLKRTLLVAGRDPALLEIPITEKDRGGFSLALTVIRDHQYMHLTQSVFVPWDDKQLKVEFATFRDTLRPGNQETWSVKVTGPKGKTTPVAAAEVLATMYDRSLDAIAASEPPTPLDLFPSHNYRIGGGNSSLGRAWQERLRAEGFEQSSFSPLHGDQFQFIGGGQQGLHGLYKAKMVADSHDVIDMDKAVFRDAVLGQMGLRRSANVQPAPAPLEMNAWGEGGLPASMNLQKEGPDLDSHPLRNNFSETAFFLPQLLTGVDGSVSLQFQVPDSVTAWKVWAHAITRDFKSGFVSKEAKTLKELMVRPYLPRFLREGDRAELKVVVNNASTLDLKGTLYLDILDPDSQQSLLSSFGLPKGDAGQRAFTAKAGGTANLTFAFTTPAKVGPVALKVTAQAGDFSDGELRPLPILPGRMHLAQSRFVALKGKSRRQMTFEDLAKSDDLTREQEQLVVTLDAQLFQSVLSALPYLAKYPYECTEQTLNRFVSTGILTSLYDKYPAVAAMAKQLSARKSSAEAWDKPDPNRAMALEETPWLTEARGGDTAATDLFAMLKPATVRTTREASLAKLRKAQLDSGAFPWFAGGAPSRWMTLYLLSGFAKSAEFGAEVPKDMASSALRFLHAEYLGDISRDMKKDHCCWETVTFLNYVLSSLPGPVLSASQFSKSEREHMLDYSFHHWKEHSIYLKGYLALALKRSGRDKDATLVWESALDAAKTTDGEGTFWPAEDRGWLWYNDAIESHAFALRTTMELFPKSEKLAGLAQWLLLNKKLNHWKSTRATAEAIYALAGYLKATGQLEERAQLGVTVGSLHHDFDFPPDQYGGSKNQLVLAGPDISPAGTSTVTVDNLTRDFAFASATWQYATDKLPAEARGDFLAVNRAYFRVDKSGHETKLVPIADATQVAIGDEVEVHLLLRARADMDYVHLRDPRAAGFEPSTNTSRHQWDFGIAWYEEVRDSGTNFFFERVPRGEYTLKYRVRASMVGTFKIAPATAQPMYAPEFAAFSTGNVVQVQDPVKAR